ncbi:methylthioribose-1-phosphate isomerase [Lysinibacillus sp. FJAT-14745]|uniref:S-methyl-5-thioribose-1-phosphate isomerase n=1 Tax=Lysinibacillus sp. FJAT-14745 TaxID=1704289 RepID=UPI0006AB8742|nr:S-methyl-5-thioribose-1-phosphate isomerase [Lysinibacillus sp. FJAT-14745]KOP78898.1 methylthioribose-1-phosphate isomerase [Lysinibacillus sp. FJAT-14745]
MELNTIEWKKDTLILLDQTKLPNDIVYVEVQTVEKVWNAIHTMIVRGAPAIGVTAAYGVYVAIQHYEGSVRAAKEEVQKQVQYLATSRPTAVNLFWALERMEQKAIQIETNDLETFQDILLQEAIAIHTEDIDINRSIGEHLLTLLEDGQGVLTHCNAGALATTKYGTATSPFYLAKERGMSFKVFADETRPRFQGAMLTSFELFNVGIDVTLITDNMAATVMAQGKVQGVIVGCDRVAANGDVANKIGTLGVAILAKYYNIPFYVATPTPTIDLHCPTGANIPIEERSVDEVLKPTGQYVAPADVKVYNPSFDVTPAALITAIVTEKGIIEHPTEEKVRAIFN